MYIKIHYAHRKVVAVCDEELIGKKFEEGKRQLDVRENFYKGEEVSEKKAKKILEMSAKDYATFNIVGDKSVNLALECGLITKGNIGKVDGVPFALVLL